MFIQPGQNPYEPAAQVAAEQLKRPKIREAGMFKDMNNLLIESVAGKDKLLQMIQDMQATLRVRG